MDTQARLKCACPSCGQHIEYPLAGSGEKVPCPSCNKEILLPNSEPKLASMVLEMPPPIPPPVFGLPEITDPAYSAIQVRSSDGVSFYTVNLLEYTCTCPSFV